MATKIILTQCTWSGLKKSLSKGNEKPPLVLHTYVYSFLLKIRLSHCGPTTLNLRLISKPSWPKPFYFHQDYINGLFQKKYVFAWVLMYISTWTSQLQILKNLMIGKINIYPKQISVAIEKICRCNNSHFECPMWIYSINTNY